MRDPDARAGCWLEGRRIGPTEATLPLDDPAVQRGLGLFETLAIRDGALLELEEHLDRLYNGLERLAIATPPRERLRSTALTALEGAASCGWLKIIVTGAGRDIVFRGAMDPADEGRVDADRPAAAGRPQARAPPHQAIGHQAISDARQQAAAERLAAPRIPCRPLRLRSALASVSRFEYADQTAHFIG